MVPIHFESWEHFTEHQADLAVVFDEEKVSHKVCWLTSGEETPVVMGIECEGGCSLWHQI